MKKSIFILLVYSVFSVFSVFNVSEAFADTLHLASPDTITAGGQDTLVVALSSTDNITYTALQIDIAMPDSINIESKDAFLMGDLCSDSHSVSVTKLSNDKLRILIFSDRNETFTAKEGELLGICVNTDSLLSEGNRTISLTGIHCSWTDKSVTRDLVIADTDLMLYVKHKTIEPPTSIDPAKTKAKANAKIIGISGISEAAGIPGIYIRNGRKEIRK